MGRDLTVFAMMKERNRIARREILEPARTECEGRGDQDEGRFEARAARGQRNKRPERTTHDDIGMLCIGDR